MTNDPTPPRPEALLADSTWMRALAHRLVRDPGVAEDAVQDTWLAALERRWPEGRPPRAWLARVMQNALRSRARGEGRRTRRERAGARREAQPSADELARRVEGQRLLAEALMALDEPLRTCLVLRYTEGLTPGEIAETRNEPLGTIHSRLKRGLDRLRRDLDRRFGGERDAWAGILLPLAHAHSPQGAVGTSLVVGGGTWIMKKTLAYVAVAGLLGLIGVGVWSARDGLRADGPPAVESGIDALPLVSRAEDARTEGPDDTPERAAVVPVEEADVAPPSRPTAPGWWVVGQVIGIDDAEAGAETTVRVEGLWEFHGDWVALDTSVEGTFEDAARGFELEISDLFRNRSRLLHTLRVTVAHPGYTTFVRRYPLDPDRRQGGYLTVRNVVIEVEAEVSPVPAVLTGRLLLPAGVEPRLVSVALVPATSSGTPAETGWVVTHPDAAGDYRLEAPELGEHRVVAYVATSRMVHADQLADLRTDVVYPIRGVEPEFLEVTVEGGEQTLEPLALSGGDVLEGRVLLADGPPGVPVTVSAYHEWPARVKLLGPRKALYWTGERFEYATLSTVADERGNFRLSGLHEKPVQVRLASVVWEGSPVWTRSPGGWFSERVSLDAPAKGVELRYDAGLFLGLLDGSPHRARYTLDLPGKKRRTAFEVGPGDRVAFFFPTERKYELQFTRPALSSESFALQRGIRPPGEWTPVRFTPDRVTSSLRLHLHGDAEREAEFFEVRVIPDGTTLDDRETRASNYYFWRDDGEEYFLSTLQPGRYHVRVKPLRDRGMNDRGEWVPPDMNVADEYFRLELPEGEAVDLDVFLRRGGTLKVRTVPEEGAKARYRLHGQGGIPVRVDYGYERELKLGVINELPSRLAPGTYELELIVDRGGAETVSTHSLEIHAGETTVVEID